MIRNAVSVFGGIEVGRYSCKEAKLDVMNYYSSEVNEHAIKIANKNHSDIIQVGDINNWRNWDIDWSSVDLLLGGSPCQGFSFAGKQLNFDDPRSKLFFVYADILNHIREVNPGVKFLLENVKMKQEYKEVITNCVKAEPIEINSALVSAQNRRRLYWTNIEGVQQPKDKGIMLADIVHENTFVDRDKSFCIDASYAKGGNLRTYSEKSRRQLIFEYLADYIVPFDKTLQILDKELMRGKIGYFRQDSQANRVYDIHGKAVTLCGDAGGAQRKWVNTYLDVSPLTGLRKDKTDKDLATAISFIRLPLKIGMAS